VVVRKSVSTLKTLQRNSVLKDSIHFGARVVEARWDEDEGKWRVRVEEGGKIIEDEAEVLTTASGVLK
jgi:cation diffusion facilitator CzcD-associated flavoprotein CzcO